MADSHISLNANRIDIEAGRSDSKEKSRGQNVGGEVGVFAQAGAQTGVGVYATLGGGSNKVDGHSTTYHSSHLDSETITINSQGNTRLRGAQAKGNAVHVNAGGDLNIESLQDEAEFKSRGNQMGVHAEISFGNAWSANANASAERGTTSRKQVNEQSGIFAEEGGYHVNADNVHLKGAAIASTNAENSELATNNFSFEDIENHSESSAVSGSISAGFSHQNERYEEKDSGKIIDQTDPRLTRGADGKINNPAVRTIAESNSPSLSPGMPMYQHSQDSTTTKSVLTEGKITLNKDSQPTQTTAAALGIQTSLENANNQVAQTENVQKQLAEQKEIREAIGNVQSAVNTYTANQATEAARAVEKLEEELAQAKAEGDNQKISEKTTALLSAQADAEAWQVGGSKKRTVDTVTAIITTALAGKTGAEIATTALSPTINQKIKELTTDENGNVDIVSNTIAHAVWGAIEATSANGNATSGAIAAASAELVAPMLAKALYGKDNVSQLSPEEKQTILTLSSMTSAITATVVGSNSADSVENLTNASQGAEIGKRAVENNFLSHSKNERLYELRDKLAKNGSLSVREEKELIALEKANQNSDYLVAKYKYDRNNMTETEINELNNHLNNYYMDEINRGALPSDINAQIQGILNDDYIKDYSYPYALTPERKATLRNNYWLGREKKEDELAYEKINSRYANEEIYRNSDAYKLHNSVYEATGYLGTTMPAIIKGVEAIEKISMGLATNAIRGESKILSLLKRGDDLYANGIYYSYNPYSLNFTKSVSQGLDSISKITPTQYAQGAILGTAVSASAQLTVKGDINYNEAIKSGLVTPYMLYTPLMTSFSIGAVNTFVSSKIDNTNVLKDQAYNLEGSTISSALEKSIPIKVYGFELRPIIGLISNSYINQINSNFEKKESDASKK